MSRLLSATVLACAALVAGPATVSAAVASPSSAAAPTYVIKIANFGFSGDLTVKTGAKVKVTNKDAVTHTFTANSGAFNTGRIAPGTSKTFTAPTKPGRYPVHCKIHADMTGTLIVKRHP